VTNGHGEASIAARIAADVRALAPLATEHLALVGERFAEAGFPDVGPQRAMPSGGLVAMGNLRAFGRDVRAGWLGLFARQLRFLGSVRRRYAAVVAVGFAWIAVPEHSDTRWPVAYPKTPDGARNDVLDLSWALRRQRGGIRERAVGRIRGLAIERLAHRGLSLTNPSDRAAIENLIGPRPYAVLTSTSGRPPQLRTVEACLDALERIAE